MLSGNPYRFRNSSNIPALVSCNHLHTYPYVIFPSKNRKTRSLSREPTPEEAVATSELIETLMAKLDELTSDRFSEPSCREVLLARLDGKEYSEICDDVEKSTGGNSPPKRSTIV